MARTLAGAALLRECAAGGSMAQPEFQYPTIEDVIGRTPLVRLQRLPGADIAARGNVILGKLEGNNPAGSVKDRPAINMIRQAEARGDIRPGDTELARDLPEQMQQDGKGRVLDPFANPDNPAVHFDTTGPEIWADTEGRITHFVSAMGTTGTITGVSRYLKERNPAVRVVGAQPSEGSRIPGIRKWPEAYLPKIYDPKAVDELVYVSQDDAEDMARRLAAEEGLFAGISAAGACWVALQLAQRLENATIVFVVCDRVDRYLSTGVFPA